MRTVQHLNDVVTELGVRARQVGWVPGQENTTLSEHRNHLTLAEFT